MSEQRLRRSLATLIVLTLVCATLALAGCGKHNAATAPNASSSSQAGGNPVKQQSATTESEDSDEATDGPQIPGTIDGAPATMSEDAFLAAYREVEGVVALDDGLMYRVISSGKGESPTLNDSVKVSYKGTLMDGKVFDQTKPGETITLPLANTIAGWREVLPLMKEGDKWEVVIPSALAYGEAGAPPAVPPNSPLVFEITLAEVVKS